MIHSIMGLCLAAGIGHAQFLSGRQSTTLDLPFVSQHASVTQRIGLTKVSVSYSRPLVGGRKLWGDLVKYDQVWRAGANENTALEVSDPFMIEGKPLPAGSYGVHMIPGKDTWTVILSKNYTSWGSFSYDKEEDAIRVTVTPKPVEFHEALTYDFDNPHTDSADLTLKWEKLAVPVKLSVDLKANTISSIKNQLRNVGGFTWEGYDDAATWLADNNTSLDQALKWSEQATQIPGFQNLQTKARILEVMGRKDEAAQASKLAMEKATTLEKYNYARGLQKQGKQTEAMAIFRDLPKNDPSSWISHLAQARVSVADHDTPRASKEIQIAVEGTSGPQKTALETLAKRISDGEDINK
jgi:hypothetical protein